jgi:hypothetical protein
MVYVHSDSRRNTGHCYTALHAHPIALDMLCLLLPEHLRGCKVQPSSSTLHAFHACMLVVHGILPRILNWWLHCILSCSKPECHQSKASAVENQISGRLCNLGMQMPPGAAYAPLQSHLSQSNVMETDPHACCQSCYTLTTHKWGCAQSPALLHTPAPAPPSCMLCRLSHPDDGQGAATGGSLPTQCASTPHLAQRS